MIPLFTKAMNAITQEDIAQLITDKYPEGDNVEYKQTLSTSDGSPDRWIATGDGIGNKARNELLEEITAFANAHGGHLILGIEETRDRPARASSIFPIPRCVELAERLQLQIRDCIDPQLPIIHVKGVPTTPEGQGVVVIRIPQSRSAPHRVTPTLNCCVRRADRCEKMTMREIQDLTLYRERGLARVEAVFEKKKVDFRGIIDRFTKAFGIRVTCIPIGSELYIDRVLNNSELIPIYNRFTGEYASRQIYLEYPYHSHTTRPILGGARHTYDEDNFTVTKNVMKNGLIEFVIFQRMGESSDLVVFPEWVIGLTLTALLTAHRFRRAVGARGCEYAFETEIYSNRTYPLFLLNFGSHPSGRGAVIEPTPLQYPRMSLGDAAEIPLLLRELKNNLFDSSGQDTDRFNFAVMIPQELLD